jgi:mannose-6-phosphate isomerase-like protein (cupin superfamily)
MAVLVPSPSIVEAAGDKPKIIEEYIGRVNTRTMSASIARMRSPAGWEEPGQKPEFDEFTVVLKGMLRVKTATQILEVRAGQAVIATRGEWVQYSSPEEGGAEYIAVCLPAFSPDTVHRDP